MYRFNNTNRGYWGGFSLAGKVYPGVRGLSLLSWKTEISVLRVALQGTCQRPSGIFLFPPRVQWVRCRPYSTPCLGLFSSSLAILGSYSPTSPWASFIPLCSVNGRPPLMYESPARLERFTRFHPPKAHWGGARTSNFTIHLTPLHTEPAPQTPIHTCTHHSYTYIYK